MKPDFRYKEIPQSVLDKGYNKPVHVKGWKINFRFSYHGTHNGVHTISSAKGGKYYTSNPLLYTQRNTPNK
jgi:hypothetical protein